MPSKSILNVILLQILQVFYSEDFQKKMTIKYGLPKVDRENTGKIFRPFVFAFRDIMLSKALSHDGICKETFIVVNLLKKFYLLSFLSVFEICFLYNMNVATARI